MFSFFSGLRGKLTLTYTLVTVLALMALEVMVLLAILGTYNYYRTDLGGYLEDVVTTLVPQARPYLQPDDQDLEALQLWLDLVSESGAASLPAQNFFDSPPAIISSSEPMFVLAPDRTILAQAPRGANDLVGRKYTLSGSPQSDSILENALQGSYA